MRFKGTSGERYGEFLAQVEREKMRAAGLEVERDSLRRCCDELQAELEQSRQREAQARLLLEDSLAMYGCPSPVACDECVRIKKSIMGFIADAPPVVLGRDERGER